MLNETASAAAIVAAWSADVYVQRDVKPAAAVLGPLAKGCVTLLAGPRGVGKSWLALSLAHAAARGGSLGPWRARKPQRVVYVDCAGAEAVLHARLMALGPPPPTLVIVPIDAQAVPPDLTLGSAREALDRIVTDADLVVIDGLSALVRTGRGVGARWAAMAAWLRALRRRNAAVLLVDVKEPRALPLLADTVLKVEAPADGVQEGDLRLQAKLLSARPRGGAQRFALTLSLRKDGAAWHYVDDVDHRAIVAYRLDRADYSSREIAKLLGVSPATGWRLVTRGSRLPKHIRDGVDLEVPIPPRLEKKRDWAKILKLAGITNPPPKDERQSLLPREKGGPAAQQRGDEGPAVVEACADVGDDGARGESPSPDPLPRERVPEATAAPEVPDEQTHQTGEALKQPAAPTTLDAVPTDEIVALYLARRRHWKLGTAPPSDRLAAFSYDALMHAARARLSARVLNRKIIEDDGATQRPLSGAERQWRTPLHVLMREKSVVY